MNPYRILTRKRAGERLSREELEAVVRGTVDGSWSDAQLGAFLMAAAIHTLEGEETRYLTEAMLRSGETWALRDEVPEVCDKHSTGGVGDKVSLVLAPLLAACGVPVVMLTGRGLGHTMGTADKLECIPGMDLELDRERCLRLLDAVGVAVGVATSDIAPADRRLYRLRDQTATVDSLPLITASILSKKLATGAGALVLDVKVGEGAFLPDGGAARALARLLVSTATELGFVASAWITDMSQPLGRWVGHASEVREAIDSLEGRGPDDLMEVTFALCLEVASLRGKALARADLEGAIASGAARESFERWVEAQGADPAWLRDPELDLAPHEAVLSAPRSGFLRAVRTRQLGLLLAEAGGGRVRPGAELDTGVALRYATRLGRKVVEGEELARLYLRHRDDDLVARCSECLVIGEDPAEAPDLLRERVT